MRATRGLREVREIGRQRRPSFYNRSVPKPVPPVARDCVVEIGGRLDERGNVVTPLDEDAVRVSARAFMADGVESVAVSYLFSFQTPAHEQRTAEILAEESADWRVSLSSVVLPTIREYPRQSTTVIDAYVGPIMQRYLERLSGRLVERGVVTPQVFLMQSNGGLMRITIGARFPNQTVLAGPAGGVGDGRLPQGHRLRHGRHVHGCVPL